MINLNPAHFASTQLPEFNIMWGDPAPQSDVPLERQQIDAAYLVFANGPGAVVLNDLIVRFVARPVMTGTTDQASAFRQRCHQEVIGNIITRLAEAQRQIQEGR